MTTAPSETTSSTTAEATRDRRDGLHRGGDGRMMGGVAVGLADYFDVDPTMVRIGFVALTLFGGLAVPLYIAGWLLIPDEGAESSIAEELLHHEQSH